MKATVLFAAPTARLSNRLLTLLRNQADLKLTREEFRYSRISFSQFGEDLAVLRWLDKELIDVVPVYVDAGCFHPIWYSNTLLLHKRGWRGINIDMTSEKVEVFKKLRPEDVSICAALSSERRIMTQIKYGDSGVTDRVSDSTVNSLNDETPIETKRVETKSLDQIIAENFSIDCIGYLNIDCEGHDLQVLKGLSIDKYRPSIITIESHLEDERNEVIRHLSAFGYSQQELLYRTLLFVREDAMRQPKPLNAGCKVDGREFS